MNDHNHHMTHGESSRKEYLKFSLVLLGILLGSLLLFEVYGGEFMDWMRYFMGVFFIVFAGFKFAGYKMFALMFRGYDLIAKRSKIYAYAYPFLELGLGLAYLLNMFPLPRDLFTFIIMSVGALGVWGEIKRKTGVHCACLGNIIKLPLSTVSLIEDISMGLMALIMLIWHF